LFSGGPVPARAAETGNDRRRVHLVDPLARGELKPELVKVSFRVEPAGIVLRKRDGANVGAAQVFDRCRLHSE
jgi:hypothetical protein